MEKFDINGWMTVLMNCNECTYTTQISKESKFTYSHVVNIVNFLVEKKFLTKIRKGRMTIISLTTKGEELQGYLFKIYQLTK